MRQNLSGIAPFNWSALVAEAIRRRKAEKLTQRQHAALASVSIPTIVSFDRGELTLSLAKAIDILRVVGLVEETGAEGAQEAFVQEAFTHWQTLTDKLPERSQARFPYGWYRIDYALEGDLKEVDLRRLHPLLEKAEVKNTGWPMFWIAPRQPIAPYEQDGTLECWLAPRPENNDFLFSDAAHCDFWRAAPNGRLFLIRGFQEDSQETFAPGTIFDTTLVMWRLGEALLHAARLAALMKKDKDAAIAVKFRAYYYGLVGRVLKSWANPLADLLVEGSASRSNEAILQATIPAENIEHNLAAHVYPLVASLFERFGVTGLSMKRVQAEIEQFEKSRTTHNRP